MYVCFVLRIGVRAVVLFREQLTEVLTSWCCGLIVGLRDKTAPPIVIAKLSQSLQMLFKTLVVFLQKCFVDGGCQREDECLERLYVEVAGFLEGGDVVNMELGYAASMIFILLLSLRDKDGLEELVSEFLCICLRLVPYLLSLKSVLHSGVFFFSKR